MKNIKLFDKWMTINPQWELRYEDLIKTYCDYGRGENTLRESRGKLFGAGYELYIIAFFIGLYYNQRKPLTSDSTKRKGFGHQVQYWGNIETRLGRQSYSHIREYMFVALVARTDFDFIGLEKGDLSIEDAIGALKTTMEEYANYGFDFIHDRIEDNPDYFYKDPGFLDIFLQMNSHNTTLASDEPESLD